MLTTTMKALMSHVAPVGYGSKPPREKVAIIGAGTVGTTIAFALLSMRIVNELVLVDKNEALARGELLDIQHAIMYIDSPKLTATSDFSQLENSKICIVTVGARSEEGSETAAEINTVLFRTLIPEITQVCPDAILLIVSHPVEVMTYVAWKLSNFQPFKVIGFGTVAQSSMLKNLIARKLECSVKNVQAFIAGEQGSHGIPLWSSVTVSGVRLQDVNPDLGTENDPERWNELFDEVVKSTNEVNHLKICGSWGIGLSVARIVKAILQDTRECLPVSVRIKGCRHGVEKDIYISLPCIVGRTGVTYTIRQKLSETEKLALQKAADNIFELQKKVRLFSPVPSKTKTDVPPGEPDEEDTPPEG